MKQQGSLIILGVLALLGLASFVDVEPGAETTDSDTIVIEVTAEHTINPTTNTPQSPDGPDSHFFYSKPLVLEEDTVITGFELTMKDADISVLHHAMVGMTNKVEKKCPRYFTQDGGMYELYAGSRNSLDPVTLPYPYGMQLSAGDVLVVEFMTHPQASPHGAHHAQEELSPTLVVTLDTNNTHTTPVEFTRLRLDDTPCDTPIVHQAFTVPTSTSGAVFTKTALNNESTASHYFTQPTTIVAGGANFWSRKGGQNVTVLFNDTPIKTFTAEPGSDTNRWNIPFLHEPIEVPASTTISIQSDYINPFDTSIKDASGMYGFYHTVN